MITTIDSGTQNGFVICPPICINWTKHSCKFGGYQKRSLRALLKMDAVNLEENSPLVSGLASIQADLLAERQKLIVELGLDGGLAEQKGLAAAAKVASKRGKVKNAEKPTAPLVARRSLRCVK